MYTYMHIRTYRKYICATQPFYTIQTVQALSHIWCGIIIEPTNTYTWLCFSTYKTASSDNMSCCVCVDQVIMSGLGHNFGIWSQCGLSDHNVGITSQCGGIRSQCGDQVTMWGDQITVWGSGHSVGIRSQCGDQVTMWVDQVWGDCISLL